LFLSVFHIVLKVKSHVLNTSSAFKMPNKCSAPYCFTNYQGHDKGTVFGLPTNEKLRASWIKFINRKDFASLKSVFLCEKHFEKRFLNCNESRTRLKYVMNPVPTIFSESQNVLPASLRPTATKLRKPPAQRVLQPDELEDFRNMDFIYSFSDINETLLKQVGSEYTFVKYEGHANFYKVQNNGLSSPEITDCIRIDSDLRVKLFYRGSPIPLPAWFKNGRNTLLRSKSMLQNFPSYIKQEAEKNSSVLDEMRLLVFQKKPIYSANLLRYALLLRHTSLSAYKLLLDELKLPSLSLLKKITAGKIDVFCAAKLLKENGNISEDVILLFDEIHLQKCEEYVGGATIGADGNGDLYKGVVCFMIVGLKSNTPYVVKTCPEREINGDWLKEELLQCLIALQENGFNVRGVVCDNHASNVSAYNKLLQTCDSNPDDLFIMLNHKKVYLFFDSVHIVKNIRNNLLQRKRFLFPDFYSAQLYDEVKVSAGEIRWRLLHEIHEKDQSLQANMKAAPKLTANVLHPGNCKQSVPIALAIFHPTTSAAIKTYFPDKVESAEFLNLFHTWWTISNSKNRFNQSHRLGSAATHGDNKPAFLREFADWIQRWDSMKISRAECFTLSSQTSSALRRTLRCHASLIEDLLSEAYDFVLTSRFQSDPIERRFGQYRQMSGGRFLISLKDVMCSEDIIKLRSLVKEGFEITPDIKSTHDDSDDLQKLRSSVQLLVNDKAIRLNDDSIQVSNYIAGYIAHKAKPYCEGCCDERLRDHDGAESCGDYLKVLSRGGLKNPSKALRECVAQGFAYLDACSDIIRESAVPARRAGEYILKEFIDGENLVCREHDERIFRHLTRTVTNIFFNNQRKRTNESVVTDRVAAFKRSKREK